jgi:hypothetical protein
VSRELPTLYTASTKLLCGEPDPGLIVDVTPEAITITVKGMLTGV